MLDFNAVPVYKLFKDKSKLSCNPEVKNWSLHSPSGRHAIFSSKLWSQGSSLGPTFTQGLIIIEETGLP